MQVSLSVATTFQKVATIIGYTIKKNYSCLQDLSNNGREQVCLYRNDLTMSSSNCPETHSPRHVCRKPTNDLNVSKYSILSKRDLAF
jgi:hypothetical protein